MGEDKNMTNGKKVRTTMIVYGSVQRSDYRGRVILIGKSMSLTGTVQNLSDGSVKIVAEGERLDINRFVDEINIRNFLIKVSKIDICKDIEIDEREYDNFYKLVGVGETDERLDTAAELLKELIIVTRGGFEKIDKKLDSRFDSLEGIIKAGQ